MKKYLLILAICVIGFATQAQTLSYPFGAVTTVTSSTDSLTLALTVVNQVTYLKVAATTLDTNLTINVTPNAFLNAGAVLYIETTAGSVSDRTVTFGTSLECTALTNTASKTFITGFVYNGTTFKAFSQKIND